MLKIVGLLGGPTVFALLMMGTGIAELSPVGQAAAAVTLLMAIWWLTEALPLYVTALVPLVLFPLTGVMDAGQTSANYGHELIFLFFGGFLLSIAVQKWSLHRRIALTVVRLVGFEPPRLILGFMVATGMLSMWISNTASAMIMAPIALAVVFQISQLLGEGGEEIDTREGHFSFGTALMLGIAYSASIGGVATIIASPSNAIFAAHVKQLYDVEITFLQWMYFGIPMSVVGITIAWLYLTKFVYTDKIPVVSGLEAIVDNGLRELGPMQTAERRVLAIFGMVASMWMLRGMVQPYLAVVGLEGLTDSTISMIGALALFIVRPHPGANEGILNWEDVSEVPWGILLLFGGGLALSSGIDSSGLGSWLGDRLGILEGASPLLVILVVVTFVMFLSELASNTSSATIFIPIAAILAAVVGVHPYILMVGTVAASSFAFMLPVGTPPNAIVFATNYITMGQMMRAGFFLNLIFIVLITLVVKFWVPLVWGL